MSLRRIEYVAYLARCRDQGVDALDFSTWLTVHGTTSTVGNDVTQHPKFEEFQTFMRKTKAGERRCPAGHGMLPVNFIYWLQGGRW